LNDIAFDKKNDCQTIEKKQLDPFAPVNIVHIANHYLSKDNFFKVRKIHCNRENNTVIIITYTRLYPSIYNVLKLLYI